MKKNRFKMIAFIFIVSMTLIIVSGCGGDETNTNSSDSVSKGTKNMSIGTGGTAGIFYPIGGGMANIINEHVDNIQAVAEVTGGSVENIRRINSGEMEMGLVTPLPAYEGYNGINKFEEKMPILGMFSMYPGYMHIFALDGNNSISDLKGKTIALNNEGTGDYDISKIILEAHGLDLKKDLEVRNLTMSDAFTAIKDRQVDAMIYSVGLNSASILELTNTVDVNLLPIAESATEEILSHLSGYYIEAIPGGTYDGTPKDADTLTSMYNAVVKNDADPDFVYEVTKAIFKNQADLVAIHPVGKYFTPENGVKGMPIPMHPGAIKFFEEEGITVPDELHPSK